MDAVLSPGITLARPRDRAARARLSSALTAAFPIAAAVAALRLREWRGMRGWRPISRSPGPLRRYPVAGRAPRRKRPRVPR